MTARSIFDHLDNSPAPSPTSWAGRQPPLAHGKPSPAMEAACAALEVQAGLTAAWLTTKHRDGIISPAEMTVMNCLRALKAIPEAERMHADVLTDVIARGFLDTAWGMRDKTRRANALLKIAGEES